MSGIDALRAWRESGGEAGPRLDPIERARANPASRSLAIKAKCFDCVGCGADPGWRWQVGNCTAVCPLTPFRPYQHLLGTPAPRAIAEHGDEAVTAPVVEQVQPEPTTPARPPWESA
jgi:hypothetical protein